MKKVEYAVRANINGKRITTEKKFKTKAEATKYAKETNKFWPGASARVVKL